MAMSSLRAAWRGLRCESRTAVVATSVAAASALLWYYWRKRREEDVDDAALQTEQTCFKRTVSRSCTGQISSRGMRLNMPSLSYLGGVLDFKDPYAVEEFEKGDLIFLGLAENKLMWSDVLMPRVVQSMKELSSTVVSYVPTQGQVALRRAFSSFLEHYVTKAPVAPEEIICGTGVSAILSNLFYCLCEEGDLVLIPAPYYSAFDSDLSAFCNLRRVMVPLEAETDYRLTVDALESAYRRSAKGAGRRPRALLLTNPHNPLGRIAPREELESVLAWCRGKGMHLVLDEIYALSCFGGASPGMPGSRSRPPVGGSSTFVSMGEVCKGDLSDDVHIIWGISKDFGMSGVRVGLLWSQNRQLLEALGSAAKFTTISGPIQAMVKDLLEDKPFVDSYILENRRRLNTSCECLLQTLEDLGLDFVMPAAGMFVWVDLRPLLRCLGATSPTAASMDDLEEELHERLIRESAIVITPGSTQGSSEPGWFRICYASVTLDTLKTAMTKFSSFVRQLQKNGGSI
eukprot:TRINITY_DN47152_c0_g1_i1.p1 TRINITY_DN47152_c0_g1~~TRINITY_DN47152_c0_g1_i1.p1  ORF type:complete len:515 (-),score=115.81 TRINITY_DN47152_c0_g1_i1:177-1721(-)